MELVKETICYISRADVVDIFKGIASKAKAKLWKYINIEQNKAWNCFLKPFRDFGNYRPDKKGLPFNDHGMW